MLVLDEASRPITIAIWVVSLLTAGVIGLAIATTAAAEDDTMQSCTMACDAAMDACTQKCPDHVDDEQCAEECLDAHDHCAKKCGE